MPIIGGKSWMFTSSYEGDYHSEGEKGRKKRRKKKECKLILEKMIDLKSKLYLISIFGIFKN